MIPIKGLKEIEEPDAKQPRISAHISASILPKCFGNESVPIQVEWQSLPCVSNLRRNQQQSSGSCRLAECSPQIWEMMRPDAGGETTERVAVGAHGYRVRRGHVWPTGRHFVKHTCVLPPCRNHIGMIFLFVSQVKMVGF